MCPEIRQLVAPLGNCIYLCRAEAWEGSSGADKTGEAGRRQSQEPCVFRQAFEVFSERH